MNLYTVHAKEFSDTRQSPWEGWVQLLPFLNELGSLRILDLGCGNGRFLKFLIDNKLKVEKYTGVDSSAEMLTMTDRFMESVEDNFHISTFELKNTDLENKQWIKEVEGPFNLIVGFGIMHHLKSFESRKAIFENAYKLLSLDSFLMLTFWQFANLERYQKLKIRPLEIPKDMVLQKNDFWLTFGQDKKAYRFCHFSDDQEITELEKDINLIKVRDFYSDGKDHKQNLYIIYERKV